MAEIEVTESLASGAELPRYPSHTTARKVVKYGMVTDADDGRILSAGLHQNEIRILMSGKRILGHIYAYALVNGCVYHTREQVVIEVECVDV